MKQSSGKRPCPVTGQPITSAECGEHRHSRYACPEVCPYNPFSVANYDRMLELDDKSEAMLIEVLRSYPAEAERLASEIQRLESLEDSAMAGSLILSAFHFRPDSSGLSVIERWAKAGFPGTKNDHRVFLGGKAQLRLVLYEVHQVLNDRDVEVVDLWAPSKGSVRLVDRSFASGAVRFGVWFGWSFPTPHFWRIWGSAIPVPRVADLEPSEVIEATLSHLGCPEAEGERSRWVAENFFEISASLSATEKVRHQDGLESMDSRGFQVVYHLNVPAEECQAILKQHPSLVPSPLASQDRAEGYAEAWDWMESSSSKTIQRNVLGKVLLASDRCCLTALGGDWIQRMRAAFETMMAHRAKFMRERMDEIGRQAVERVPAELEATVPPRLRENPPEYRMFSSLVPLRERLPGEAKGDFQDEMKRAWLGQPLPALHGKTPREAALDPALRPALVRLVKDDVCRCDAENLRDGTNRDINWMIQELGLVEILFPAPPLRVRPNQGPVRRPAPPLPKAPLSPDAAVERVHRAAARFNTEDGLQEIADSGASVLDWITEVAASEIGDDGLQILCEALPMVWFGLVEPGSEAPRLDRRLFAESYQRALRVLASDGFLVQERGLDGFIRLQSQPDYSRAVILRVMESARDDKDRQAFAACFPWIVGGLFAVIEELDRALRPERGRAQH